MPTSQERRLVRRLSAAVAQLLSASGRPVGPLSGGPAAVRVAHVLLWGLVAVGALAGVGGLLTSAPAPVGKAAQSDPRPAPGVPGFVELYVATFVTAGSGDEETLDPFLAGTVDLAGVEGGALFAARVAAVALSPVDESHWAVTVAAELLERRDGGYSALGVRHYQVGVVEVSGGLVATALPALVPPPTRGAGPELAGPGLGLPEPGDPVAATVGPFLGALLAGQGEVARYAAPGAVLAPVVPAPFAEVRLDRMAVEANGALRRVRASVEATTASGRRERLQYALELAERQGRWEVLAVGGAPALEPSAPGPVPPPASPSPTVPPGAAARPTPTTGGTP